MCSFYVYVVDYFSNFLGDKLERIALMLRENGRFTMASQVNQKNVEMRFEISYLLEPNIGTSAEAVYENCPFRTDCVKMYFVMKHKRKGAGKAP